MVIKVLEKLDILIFDKLFLKDSDIQYGFRSFQSTADFLKAVIVWTPFL